MFELIASIRTALAARAAEDRGATAVEYGLMVALIAVVIIGAVFGLGQVLNTGFENTCDTIATAQNNGTATDCPTP